MKSNRVLAMYHRLLKGEGLSKQQLSTEYDVTPKSIQRDLETIRDFLAEEREHRLIYDRRQGMYVLQSIKPISLASEEVIAILKILYSSRGFVKEEMQTIVEKLVNCTTDPQTLRKILRGEDALYVPTQQSIPLLSCIKEFSEAIYRKQIVHIQYRKENGEQRMHRIQPLALIFSEFYFYVVAHSHRYKEGEVIHFRCDRIQSYEMTKETFRLKETSRITEAEFKKRVLFMQPGQQQYIRFKFWGKSINAILDRFPTSRIVKEENGVYTLEGETKGTGAIMLLLSQGESVEVLEPFRLRDEFQRICKEMSTIYEGETSHV